MTEGVKCMRIAYQMMERYNGHGVNEMGHAPVDRKCDSHQGGVKGIRKVGQLMERCNGHGGGVRGFEKV